MKPEQLKKALSSLQEDDLLDEGDALLRGHLPKERAEALRTSQDPKEKATYALFSPLGRGFEDAVAAKLTRMLTPWWKKPRYVAPLLLAAASIAAILYVRLGSSPEPYALRDLKVDSELAPPDAQGHQILGEPSQAANPQAPLVLGPCVSVRLPLKPGQKATQQRVEVLAYLQQGSELVRWPLEMEKDANTSLLVQKGRCATAPKVAPGAWDMVVISGTQLPNWADLDARLKSRRPAPADAPYQIERRPIVIPQDR